MPCGPIYVIHLNTDHQPYPSSCFKSGMTRIHTWLTPRLLQPTTPVVSNSYA
jgi:hypothetical protein